MSPNSDINKTSLNWLLGEQHPGVRYLAMRDLYDLEIDDSEVIKARQLAHHKGPIASILDEMYPEGYWVKAGPGYNPKYHSTVWAIILLAQLGASIHEDERIERACRYILDHTLTDYGQFSVSGTPGSTIDCLQGNLCASLLDLGIEDNRLDKAFEWMARSVTGEGVAALGDKNTFIRYYSGNCGPDFACGANNKQACAWGAVKVMLAFSKLPTYKRTSLIEKAIMHGIDFLLSGDPAEAPYPNGLNDKPSRNWWKFGFPVFYVTDLLQNIEALVGLGLGGDPRLAHAFELIREKQDSEGRWPMEYNYNGKTWVDFGPKGKPNKWVTYRAMKVLKIATRI
jgi:hypothetical protein